MKRPYNISFRRALTCNSHTIGNGRRSIIKSWMTFMIPKPKAMVLYGRHLGSLISLFQLYSIGTHWKIWIRAIPTCVITTKIRVILATS